MSQPQFILISTSAGNIKIKMLRDQAPKTCETISKLVSSGLYNGCCFYRAEPGFVVQGGLRTPEGTVRKSPFGGIPLEYGALNKKGTVTLARWEKTDSGDSEFFINLNNNTNLDRYGTSGWALGFAVWGMIVEGMDVVEAISNHPTTTQGGLKMLTRPVAFTSVSLV
ncbi:peptidyl-prolyl cis-trans isomerase A [Pelomyxa schiedti]|nr:peptidyl-prolyl cis-trans isomerase A [Pelomyxa schiedti]